jgi:hypothetical protein
MTIESVPAVTNQNTSSTLTEKSERVRVWNFSNFKRWGEMGNEAFISRLDVVPQICLNCIKIIIFFHF